MTFFFKDIKTMAQGQPNTPWQICCSTCWSLPPRNPQMCLQPPYLQTLPYTQNPAQVTAGKARFPAFFLISCVANCAYCLFSLPCLSPSKCFISCCSQTEPDDAGSSDGSGCPQTATQRTPIHKPFTQCRPPMEMPLQPAPHSVTEEELYFVRSCLQRWRAEVETTVNGRFFTE